MKAYNEHVIPGTLRYVSNQVQGGYAYDVGFEIIISRCTGALSKCLTFYDHGDPGSALVLEDAVNDGNAVWRADVLMDAP